MNNYRTEYNRIITLLMQASNRTFACDIANFIMQQEAAMSEQAARIVDLIGQNADLESIISDLRTAMATPDLVKLMNCEVWLNGVNEDCCIIRSEDSRTMQDFSDMAELAWYTGFTVEGWKQFEYGILHINEFGGYFKPDDNDKPSRYIQTCDSLMIALSREAPEPEPAKPDDFLALLKNALAKMNEAARLEKSDGNMAHLKLYSDGSGHIEDSDGDFLGLWKHNGTDSWRGFEEWLKNPKQK